MMKMDETVEKAKKGFAAVVFGLVILSLGCLGFRSSNSSNQRSGAQPRLSEANRLSDYEATGRLRRAMMPLINAMDRPCRPEEVRVEIVNEPAVNAANAGGCQFFVTSGLLRSAKDNQLAGVMAHEIAHQDLGHAAKAQMISAGLNLGAVLLQQIFPAAGAIAPLAGTLIARGHSRTEEYAADRHAVALLRRAGYPGEVMIDTLSWIRRTSDGEHAGGFLSTHPGIDERISALRKIR